MKTRLAFGAALFISWVATARGLMVLMPWYLAFLASFVIATFLGVFAVNLVPRWHSPFRWMFSVMGYAAFAFFSVLFASAFYFEMVSGSELEKDKVSSAQQALLAGIGDQKEYFAALSERLQDLARYSREQAKIENVRGGTCVGSRGKGTGPFWAKRMWQADQFERISQSFAKLSKTLNAQVAKVTELANSPALPALKKQLKLKQEIPLISAYAKRDDVRLMLQDLDNQGKYEMEGFPRDGRYCYQGKCFGGKACKDSQLVERIRAVRMLGNPKPLSVEFDIYDASSVQQNIKQVIGLWSAIFDDKDGQNWWRSKYALPLGMGLLFDFGILVMGLLLGSQQRAHPGRRLSKAQFERLGERIDDIVEHYPSVFQLNDLPPSQTEYEAMAHRIQRVVDYLTHPVGADKVFFLPENENRNPRSRRRPMLEPEAEARLDAVVEVLNVLSRERLIGEPPKPLRNQHKTYGGFTTEDVAELYGLDPGSVEWFRVFIVSSRLMADIGHILEEEEETGRLPAFMRLIKNVLVTFRPYLFDAEHAFVGRPSVELVAEHLHQRCKNVSLASGENEHARTGCRLILYPELSVKDRVMDHFLRDDDYGLHTDLQDVSPWWAWFIPHRRYILGPESMTALLTLVRTQEAEEAGQHPG